MGLRQWCNENPQAVTIGAVVAVAIALGVVVWQMRSDVPATGEAQVYFWDVETEERFGAPAEMPPIEAPSSGRGVRAHLFTCGECTPDEWFGFLETVMDEAKERYEQDGEQPGDDDWLVRSLDGGEWVRASSRQGMRIAEIMHGEDPCPNPDVEPIRECMYQD